MEGTIIETPKSNPWVSNTQPSKCPWGRLVQIVPCSLEDVMNEQLANELQNKEDMPQTVGIDVDPEIQDLINASCDGSDADTSSDLVLARMLQMQLDAEHNQLVMAQEKQLNGMNKVTLSFQNYTCPYPEFKDDCVEEEYDNEEVKTAWEKQSIPNFSAQGYAGKGKNITTKHDPEICGRKNASKMMNEFPPEFICGDGEGMDMQLPNHVYNKLKRHSESENKRQQRLHEKKEHSTAEQAMDPRTRLILYKLVNNRSLESISGTISTGKESVVLHACGGKIKDDPLPAEVAIKVFKTTLNEFKNREKYVHGDHRFAKDDYKKQNPRKIIKMWALKETANLNRMKKFNIPCPEVQLVKKHILVMSFIGEDRKPAPKLKDAKLSPADLELAYNQVVQIVIKIYRDCGLVHADLSEYNMLWFKDQVWIIDVSQAVDITHPSALEFLVRDCHNVANFFSKNGVHDVPAAEELFNIITELDIKGTGADFIAQVQRFDKEKNRDNVANQSSAKKYAFDYFFENSLQERIDFDQLHISDDSDEKSDEEQ